MPSVPARFQGDQSPLRGGGYSICQHDTHFHGLADPIDVMNIHPSTGTPDLPLRYDATDASTAYFSSRIIPDIHHDGDGCMDLVGTSLVHEYSPLRSFLFFTFLFRLLGYSVGRFL